MEILNITENDDGSCTMDCEFTPEEVEFFVDYAVVDILKKQIKRYDDQEANLDE